MAVVYGRGAAADMRIYNLKIFHKNVPTLPSINARMLWMSSSNSIKHVQVIRIFNFLSEYYFLHMK